MDQVLINVQCCFAIGVRLLRRCGKSKAWLGKKSDSEVNGSLFEELAYDMHHPKRECVNYFRDGRVTWPECVCAVMCVLRYCACGCASV